MNIFWALSGEENISKSLNEENNTFHIVRGFKWVNHFIIFSTKNIWYIFTTNIDSTNGRGIVILAHSSISHLVLEVKPDVQFEEVCLLELKLEGNNVMIFGPIYRSPTQTSRSDKNNNNLNTLVRRLANNKIYFHICLTGDLNFHINWD